MKKAGDEKLDMSSGSKCQKDQKNQDHKTNATYDENGMVGLVCARHDYPLLFCDLFHGERYVYCDILLDTYTMKLKAMFEKVNGPNDQLPKIYLYYDRPCHFQKHAKKHKVPFDAFITKYLVPKMHIKVHDRECKRDNDPGKCNGCGSTDGEACERLWASLSPLIHMVHTKRIGWICLVLL